MWNKRHFFFGLIFFTGLLWGQNNPITQGHHCFKKSQFKQAHEFYLKAVLANPLDGEATLYLGLTFFALNRYSDADYCLRRGLEFTKNPDFEMNIFALFSDPKKFQTHKENLEKASALQNKEFSLQTVLSYIYFFSGEQEKAKLLFHQLILANPKDAFARFFIERINREEQARYAKQQQFSKKALLVQSSLEEPKKSPTSEEEPLSLDGSEGQKTGEKESFSKEKTKNTFSH